MSTPTGDLWIVLKVGCLDCTPEPSELVKFVSSHTDHAEAIMAAFAYETENDLEYATDVAVIVLSITIPEGL